MSEFDDESVPSRLARESTRETSSSRETSNTNISGSPLFGSRDNTDIIRSSKFACVVILGIVAAFVGLLTYRYTMSREDLKFEEEFNEHSVRVIKLAHERAELVYASLTNFGVITTSYTLTRNLTWPFVTLPHFEARGMQSIAVTKADLVNLVPIVSGEERGKWESYSVGNQGWLQEGVDFDFEFESGQRGSSYFTTDAQQPISEFIFRPPDHLSPDESEGPYLPSWQLAPAPVAGGLTNKNILFSPLVKDAFQDMNFARGPVLSRVGDVDGIYGTSTHQETSHPRSLFFQPVFEGLDEGSDIVAALVVVLPWDVYFTSLLPPDTEPLDIVIKDTCGDVFTYKTFGPEILFVGHGDHHDVGFSHMEKTGLYAPGAYANISEWDGHCEYDIHVYPTQQFKDKYTTLQPTLFTLFVCLVFVFTTAVFVTYDYLVERRQRKFMDTAKRSNAIVSALFPRKVRDQLMKEAQETVEAEIEKSKGNRFQPGAKTQIIGFLKDGNHRDPSAHFDSKPIADLFPSATVLFADLVGFTAWSSVREPAHIFELLETIYNAFDDIAKRRRVFKVETVGDCYVAVTGLPEPRKDHAVVMARFAVDIQAATNDLVKKLELTLGPDTGDLALRIGLHSGPVTAGVLRGDKSRFQLFGDTVNTAARMESTGVSNRIQMTSDTASLLEEAGKVHWMRKREEKVMAKGKGVLDTFWLDLRPQSGPSSGSGVSEERQSRSSFRDTAPITPPPAFDIDSEDDEGENPMIAQVASKTASSPGMPLVSSKVQRLVSWNVDVLSRLLKQIVARRKALGQAARNAAAESFDLNSGNLSYSSLEGQTVLDEFKAIITLPPLDAKAAKEEEDPSEIDLDPIVIKQLRDYVTIIASMYRNVPFHNIEHASHVTMSVVKLLSRIVAPDEVLEHEEFKDAEMIQSLHDHTYGITSDPLTQFAVVFSALIHDVDHTGVPNATLVKEQVDIASIYRNKSVAEQNSVDLAWDLLMDKSFRALRSVIYSTEDEMRRFRQLIVNVVMATDIADKELKELRNNRWERAFHPMEDDKQDADPREDINRKATIVIEHLIQASDISHTMQHWHIYRKWNERFFKEMLLAFKLGRAEKDPSEFWYKGEIGFFDFYIIPLAKKLKDCGVFGVSSDEYLNYAVQNRKEWEIRGEKVVAQMIEKYSGMSSQEIIDHEQL